MDDRVADTNGEDFKLGEVLQHHQPSRPAAMKLSGPSPKDVPIEHINCFQFGRGKMCLPHCSQSAGTPYRSSRIAANIFHATPSANVYVIPKPSQPSDQFGLAGIGRGVSIEYKKGGASKC